MVDSYKWPWAGWPAEASRGELLVHNFEHAGPLVSNKCIKCNNVINIIVTLLENKKLLSFVSAIVMVNCYYVARIPYN